MKCTRLLKNTIKNYEEPLVQISRSSSISICLKFLRVKKKKERKKTKKNERKKRNGEKILNKRKKSRHFTIADLCMIGLL